MLAAQDSHARTRIKLCLALLKPVGVLGVDEEDNARDFWEVLYRQSAPASIHSQPLLTSFHNLLAC